MKSATRAMCRAGSRMITTSEHAGKTNEEILSLLADKKLKFHELERALAPDYQRAVGLRRDFVKQYMMEAQTPEKQVTFDAIPFENYDYTQVVGSNCENLIGYLPLPLGVAGPILMDGKEYPIPMATTEGALVASTHRGARCISRAGGVSTRLTHDGMTRAPVVGMPNMARAVELQKWVEGHLPEIQGWFSETTRYGRVQSVLVRVVGRKVFLRFRAVTGDAMGMNMISKGTDNVMRKLQALFTDMEILSLSGNMCTDKKPSAINWVEGRGKGVVAEAVIPANLVEEVLKTDVQSLVNLNIDKNLVGSAMAGSIGGFNAHAANAVAAVFLACGQDPAQVVESATAITIMEKDADGSLRISVTMPSIEVGTVGGGTTLTPQRGVLEMIGCAGANGEKPGENAQLLARVVGAAVLSAELSLMAGLCAGHLVRAHMELNRK
eukprot:TRINITY_DN13445_c0_g1_i1.p2 TRINITY_DN13445_c0_g1~~TRINITY_DN13445_c0_g1_i1.p2  ORF type:complete len:481 (+),score=214.34 TRINITY_DN13445_c0_g1_i1:132-1445(+)